MLRKLWRWLTKPTPPRCNADWMTLGWCEADAYGHYTDCPIHGDFAGADARMTREARDD